MLLAYFGSCVADVLTLCDARLILIKSKAGGRLISRKATESVCSPPFGIYGPLAKFARAPADFRQEKASQLRQKGGSVPLNFFQAGSSFLAAVVLGLVAPGALWNTLGCVCNGSRSRWSLKQRKSA